MSTALPVYRLTTTSQWSTIFSNLVRSQVKPGSPHWHRIETDLAGSLLKHPPGFLLLVDETHLHFLIMQAQSVIGHPDGALGSYQEELWRYDAGELFLSNPENGEYLEFNLSPQGGWWSCSFTAPRQPNMKKAKPLSGVQIDHAENNDFFFNAMHIPLMSIRKKIDLDLIRAKGNVTFMAAYPNQQFASYGQLTERFDDLPDYHRPNAFPTINILDAI